MKQILTLGAVLGAALLGACGGSDEPDKPEGPQKLNSEQLVRQAGPSTVKLWGKWGDGIHAGTGVVIDARNGYVLTNAHVVDGTSGLKAQVNDEPTEYTARIKAMAPCEDLALVEFPTKPNGLRAMPTGNSSKLKAGQHVTTLGYPGTLDNSETAGSNNLVYADGRISTPETSSNLPGLGEYQSLVQHTAAVNPGNSGGPLVDDFGRLMGINTLGNSGMAGEVQNQFYSITINHAKPTIETLEQGISIADVGWTLSELDRTTMADLFEIAGKPRSLGRHAYDLMAADGEEGLLVINSRAGTPAERSNFVTGDYITHIDGNKVTTQAEACDAFESATPGSIVNVDGYYITSAYQADHDVFDSFSQNVRVPRDEAPSGIG
jgi:S1-C subfamily serine protease